MVLTMAARRVWRIALTLALLIGFGLSLTPVDLVAANGEITPEDLEAYFDATLARQMAEEHLVGATVSVVRNDALVFAKGYGYADLEAGVPVEADRTLFYIGSDGKLFTWTAVMQLVEQGKLDLHADVNTYLDFEVPAAFGRPVTMHHLMTHTAGFEEQLTALMAAGPSETLPLREFLVRNMPARVYPPGEIYAYSNYGTALAGYIVERLSNEPYEAYIATHLLEPLGMDHSASVQPLPPALMADMSKGYHYRDGVYDALDFEWAAAAPAAAVRATSTDMARFMIAHLSDGCVDGRCILQPETVDQMHRHQFSHHPAMTGMAYGFLEAELSGERVLWHLGMSPRFTSILALIPEQDLGLFVSYNTPPADPTATLFEFMDAFYSEDGASEMRSVLPGWPERADALEGTYLSTRVAHTSNQKILGRLDTLTVRGTADGSLVVGDMHYAETSPWLFTQTDGHRMLSARASYRGQTWIFWGPFAYIKIPWYQTLTSHLAVIGASALLLVFGWVAWPVASWVGRRQGRHVDTLTRLSRWLAFAMGLLNLGLLVWFAVLMVGYGETFVYPTVTLARLARLTWLSVPLALAVIVLAIRAWRRREPGLAWRIHYSLVAVAGMAFVGFWVFWNLM